MLEVLDERFQRLGGQFLAIDFEGLRRARIAIGPVGNGSGKRADMVMASGSGLDPHITLKNALYQLDRVAAKRAADTNRDVAKVRQEIKALLNQKKDAPLGGLVGIDLVNVLEVNLALSEQYESKAETSR